MPRSVCCVPKCSIIATDGVPLHYFPNPETFAEKFQVWVKNIGGDIASLDSATVLKTRRICRRHFETQFLYPKNRLSKLAVPTLLLPSRDISGMHAVLHGFPNPEKDRLRFNTWLYSIGSDILGLENAHIFKFRRVCHKHFQDRYLCRNNRISNIAVPTLYLPGASTPVVSKGSVDLRFNSPSVQLSGATTPSTQKELYVCNDSVPTGSKASLVSISAPGTSRATGSTIDITQTQNSSGETKTIAEALPTFKSPLLKPIIEDKVQDITEITPELPSCTTIVENTDICDDDDDADHDSDTLVASNVCRVCLAMDVKMYDLNDIELREMFQNITGIAVTENNHSILERLCWECAGRLKAAAAFRNQALLSDALLQGLASTGRKIRRNDITLIKENEYYLKSVGSSSAVEVLHIVDIDPENDSVPPISENNDTEIVQKTVRNDSIKLNKDSIIKEDNDQMDVEAPIATKMEYDQFDHISRNTGEESNNIFLETNPVVTNNVAFKEDKINSANSSPPPSCSHVEPKYPISDYLLKTPSDLKDKIKKPIIKLTRDSISKIVSKNSNEVMNVLKGDTKLKNIYVKIGGFSKKTSKLKLVKKT